MDTGSFVSRVMYIWEYSRQCKGTKKILMGVRNRHKRDQQLYTVADRTKNVCINVISQ
jgi:hypothetical protein